MADFDLVTLENGIRVVHKEVTHTKIAHLAIMFDIGSRDEKPAEQGITHFWEHMAFKGTEKRRYHHIINRLESLGGELNAYTTKEKICFYASILSTHLDKAAELLVDIAFHSVFPEKQIEKERMVILEEMSMYRDTPEDALLDDFEDQVFADHPLGRNILGTEHTLKSIDRTHFVDYLARNLNTTRISVASLGNYDLRQLQRCMVRHLDNIPYKNHTQSRTRFRQYQPVQKEITKDILQVHHVMGIPAYSIHHPKRIALFLLTNILGGPAMNSRLNMSLRERHGYVYGVEASFSSLTDTGLFHIAFATDPKNLKKSLSLVNREIKKLQVQPLSIHQLDKAKQQLKGQMAMSEENNNAMLLMMAKSILDLDTVPSIERIFDKIDHVTADELVELANDALDLDQMSRLTFLSQD